MLEPAMLNDSGLKLFGVIGHPIAHSLSPLMHNTAFEALGLHCSMQALDIRPESLHDAIQSFRALGFGGINVTIPHKERIMPFLDDIETEARAIGAVNTIQFVEGKAIGYNTDAYGFRLSLEPYRSRIDGSTFAILGAGGAARSVVYVLLKHFRSAQIVIVSRSLTRSRDIIEHFKEIDQHKLAAITFEDPALSSLLGSARLIVNATPIGMNPRWHEIPFPPEFLHNKHVVFDLVYRPLKTNLLAGALQRGAMAISGMEMFLQQGARAFELWTGRQMDIESVRATILAFLQREDAPPF
jgi:shikimate dehydrogenase